ncbi:MAG TPA: hypothetical protein VLT89_11465 [Usitatibacter sp.]|nr:hypothetical protein [Usitatibacter sp.]
MVKKTKVVIYSNAKMGKPVLPSKKMAAQIGHIIARHSYLEWVQSNLVHAIMQISIKQGRVAVKLSRPKQYPNDIAALLSFHHIYVPDSVFPLNNYGRKLDRAERARNMFAHCIFVRDPENRKVRIQLVRGTRDDITDPEAYPVFRAVNPECPYLTDHLVTENRQFVEEAIAATFELGAIVDNALQASNDKRRQLVLMDRRRHPTQSTQTPPRPA